jgi:hypothetical protein
MVLEMALNANLAYHETKAKQKDWRKNSSKIDTIDKIEIIEVAGTIHE